MSRMSEIYAEMLKANQHVDLFGGPAKEQELTATLRDQFAMAALPAIIADPDCVMYPTGKAKVAYQYADAMLKARQWLPEKEEE